MSTLYKSFLRNAWWNTIESIVYHGTLMSHQWLVFNTMPRETYGLAGILFSIIYLSISLINMGFDHAVGTHWQESCRSKKHFIHHVWYQLIPNYIVIIIATSGLLLSGVYYPYINTYLVLILAVIIGSESMKKSGKVILQLMFKSHITASTDSMAIVLYTSMVWGWYGYTQNFTLYSVFVPLLISSLLSAMLFFSEIIKFYSELSDEQEVTFNNKPIAHNRLYSFLSDMSQQLFSGNILIPLLAMHVGLHTVGTFKLISHLCHSVGAIIYNVFGLTSQVLFAHAKNMHYTAKQAIFSHITNYIHHALYACAIFGIINFQKIMGDTSTHNTTDMLMIGLYFVIIFSQNFFIPYEKLFLNEEKTHYLAIIQLLAWSAMYITIWCIAPQSAPLALVTIVLIRLISYGLLGLIAARSWSITPSWQLQPVFGLAAVLCSCVFFWLWQ